jgi:hypothetical protein
MHEALCRSFGTTLDMVHDEGGPPLTQRTSGLERDDASVNRRWIPESARF